MTTIELIVKEYGPNNCYIPADSMSAQLMQHCMNEDLSEVNDIGLEKLQAVADAHNWIVHLNYE